MEDTQNGLTLESAVSHAEEVANHDQGHVTIPNQLTVAKIAVNLVRHLNQRLAIINHALVCISFSFALIFLGEFFYVLAF